MPVEVMSGTLKKPGALRAENWVADDMEFCGCGDTEALARLSLVGLMDAESARVSHLIAKLTTYRNDLQREKRKALREVEAELRGDGGD